MASNSTIFLADTEVRAGEAAGTATVRIARSGSLDTPVTVTYGVTGNTAADGQDFEGGFGTITMPAGVAEVSVQVKLLDDAAAESTEVVGFSLINVEGEGASLWAPRTARISILDDENPAPPPPAEPPLVSDYTVKQTALVGGLDGPVNAPPRFAALRGSLLGFQVARSTHY